MNVRLRRLPPALATFAVLAATALGAVVLVAIITRSDHTSAPARAAHRQSLDGPAPLAGSHCSAQARSRAAAEYAGARFLQEYVDYGYGRAGRRPPLPHATRELARRVWAEPSTPPPGVAGTHPKITHPRASLVFRDVARVRAQVAAGRDTYALTAVVNRIGCRWLAVGVR
jgi:hypothetical protein